MPEKTEVRTFCDAVGANFGGHMSVWNTNGKHHARYVITKGARGENIKCTILLPDMTAEQLLHFTEDMVDALDKAIDRND